MIFIQNHKRLKMASNLPAFAQALKRRRQTLRSSTSTDRDLPERDENVPSNSFLHQDSECSGRPRKCHPAKPNRSNDDLQGKPRRFDDDDELLSFSPVKTDRKSRHSRSAQPEPHRDISTDDENSVSTPELQGQIRVLELENRKLQRQNRDIQNDISSLKSDRTRGLQLSSSLAIAESEIADLKTVLQSKNATISKLTKECDSLEKDYQLLSEIRSKESEKAATKQMEITRLQQELDNLKQNVRVGVPESDSASRFRGIPEPERPIRRPTLATPPAMKDNLVFGDGQPSFRAARGLLTDQMTDTELHTRYQTLVKEKEDKERILNRVAPKGSKISRVRVEKEQLEQELLELNPQITKIKSEMTKRGIY